MIGLRQLVDPRYDKVFIYFIYWTNFVSLQELVTSAKHLYWEDWSFIDTSPKFGHGFFQIRAFKASFMGPEEG